MLTKKQLELLLFIDAHMKTNHTAPSFEEMKEAVKLRSKSGIHRLVTALEERGFLRRLPHRARALEVVKVPQQQRAGGEDRPHLVPASSGLRGNVIPGDFGQQERAGKPATARPRVVSVPLYGRIAAGVPIEALRDESTRLDLPASLLGSGEHYALEVEGDSMIEAGIFDGDTALIQRCDSAENGAIVVALVDDNEVTLKRLRRKGESIALEPANPAYETRIFGPSLVRVQGRLVGLLRRY